MRAKGKLAELRALTYLKRRGLRPLDSNYYSPFGEIDLILRDQDQLVFVEVRSKATTRFGTAQETIDRAKQTRIIKTARHYLHHHGYGEDDLPCRFDVIAIHGLQLEWIKNAFTA